MPEAVCMPDSSLQFELSSNTSNQDIDNLGLGRLELDQSGYIDSIYRK